MIAAAVVFALVLGALIFVLLPRERPWQRAAAVGLYVVLLATVLAGGVDVLGRPKPVRLEWRAVPQAKLIAATMRESEGIYLWLEVPGESAPRAYAMAWSAEAASQLEKAMSEAQENGTGVAVSRPFDGDPDESAPRFYAMPQPPMPDKDYSGSGNGPVVLQAPGSAG